MYGSMEATWDRETILFLEKLKMETKMISCNMCDKNFEKIKLRELTIPTLAPTIQIFICLVPMADMCQGTCSDY